MYVFGEIYIEEIQQEVDFEYNWNAIKPYKSSDYENYLIYATTPWQKAALPYKISAGYVRKNEYTGP